MQALRYIWRLIIYRKFWLAAAFAAPLIVAIFISATLADIYESRAVINFKNYPELYPDSISSEGTSKSELDLAKTFLLTRHNLLTIARMRSVFRTGDRLADDQIVAAMLANTSVTISAGRNDATLMTIAFRADAAATASQVVSDYVDTLLAQNTTTQTEAATQTADFLRTEVDRLRLAAETSRTAVQAFQQAHQQTLPQTLPQRRVELERHQNQLRQLERDVFDVKSQKAALVAQLQTGALSASAPTTAEQEVSRLKRDLSTALAIYAAKNPKVIALQGRLAQAESLLARERAAAPGRKLILMEIETLEARLSDATSNRAALQDKIDALEASLRNTTTALELDRLRNDLTAAEDGYQKALAKLSAAVTGEQLSVSETGQRMTVIEPPTRPTMPSGPDRKAIVFGGGLVGLLAAAGVFLVLERGNRMIRRSQDLIESLGLTPIVTIPQIAPRPQPVAAQRVRY
ncbi:GumC family protein [Pseudooceanicola sp. MF1-13]|uniref:GumC family protein n=1 Tax=Pseudooceanicola sp. MF1-13 TaxID=3379095 RepID=UPI003891257D